METAIVSDGTVEHGTGPHPWRLDGAHRLGIPPALAGAYADASTRTGRPAGPARLPSGAGPAHRRLTRVMRACGAGYGDAMTPAERYPQRRAPGEDAMSYWMDVGKNPVTRLGSGGERRPGRAGWRTSSPGQHAAPRRPAPARRWAASGTWRTGPSRRWTRCRRDGVDSGVTRTRMKAIAVVSAGMAVSSTFVGGTVAAAAAWLFQVVIVWGYVEGLPCAFGPPASVVVGAVAGRAADRVGLPLRPGDAALRAGFLLAGGLFEGSSSPSRGRCAAGDPSARRWAGSWRASPAYAPAWPRSGPVPRGPRFRPRPGSPTRPAVPGRAARPEELLKHARAVARLTWPRSAPAPPVRPPRPASRDAGRHWRLAGRTLTVRPADRAGLLCRTWRASRRRWCALRGWSWAGESSPGI